MNKPKKSRAEIEALVHTTDQVYLVGIRGYYEDTMGKPGQNDRGIYDDAMFLVAPGEFYSFNANTDPSVVKKGVSMLKPGIYPYRKGKHGLSKPGGGYPALRPATPGEALPVVRDDVGESTGVAINIHRGSYNSTSSLGCQTIYPAQWDEFITAVYRLMGKTINYHLIEN